MNTTQEILKSSYHDHHFQPQRYYDCIESCFECASTSWICADACLNENDPLNLQDCIRNCLTAAEICSATAKALISQAQDSEFVMAQIKSCMEILQMTIKECQKHGTVHEHCHLCAKCCEECLTICRSYLEELTI